MIISDVAEAVKKLKSGQPVAIPTETVYGLAAPLSNITAIKKVFEIKKRPLFDPLIVHVSSEDQARFCVNDWPEVAHTLAKGFWPGPLTLVLQKSDRVDDLVSAGLPSVAVRWSSHPLLQEVIDRLGEPIVAPSANLFGRTSPTRASHVETEFSKQVPVLDGGECEVGIESTVLSLQSEPLQILRPGIILPSAIRLISGKEVVEKEHAQQSPGHLKDHYQPQKPLFIVDGDRSDFQLPESFQHLKIGTELVLADSPVMAARSLYARLRKSDQTQADYIFVVQQKQRQGEAWDAIWDRLKKASQKISDNTPCS